MADTPQYGLLSHISSDNSFSLVSKIKCSGTSNIHCAVNFTNDSAKEKSNKYGIEIKKKLTITLEFP